MEISGDINCGLYVQAKNEEEHDSLISHLGQVINRTDSFLETRLLEKDKSFTRERYLQTLQSQLSVSSGYSSIDSLSSYCRKQRSTLLPSQALSVIIHLERSIKNEKLLADMQNEPWHFHHAMQLLDWENSCVVAKQDFYEISPELPLVNISLDANKKNIIRYNLFVRHLRRMRKFYEDVLGKYPCFTTDDFCCFVLKSTDSCEVQFSLKRSRHLDIFVGKQAQLVFQVAKTDSFLSRLTKKAVIETSDPEGNDVILVTGSDIGVQNFATKPSRNLQRNSSTESKGSSTLVGDCSLIRTRRKPTNRSNSTSESDTSSSDSISTQDGVIFSGRPIVL